MEKQKKQYAGNETSQKITWRNWLWSHWYSSSNLALRFDMDVHGYDPYMSVDAAWNLSRYV